MKKSAEILGLPIISITEGRELGMSKTLVIDAKNALVAAITVEDEEWYRGVKLIPYASIIAIGDDAITILHSDNILKLGQIGSYEPMLVDNIKILDTKAITKTGKIRGKISEIIVGDDGKIVKCEIRAADGSISDVSADNISIFSRQVTVIDMDGVKRTAPPVKPVEEVPTVSEIVKTVEEVPTVSEIANPVEEIPTVSEIVKPIEEVPTVSEIVKTVEEVPTVSEIVKPVEEVPTVSEIVKPVGEVPNVSEIAKPVEEIPNVSEIAKPVEEVPTVSEIVKPVEEVPTVSEIVKPVEEVPTVSEIVKPVEEIPNVSEIVKPVEEVPTVSEIVKPVEEVPNVSEIVKPVEEIPNVSEIVKTAEEIQPLAEMATDESDDEEEVEMPDMSDFEPEPEPEPAPPPPPPEPAKGIQQAEALKAALRRAMENQQRNATPAAKTEPRKGGKTVTLVGRKVTKTITADNGTVIIEAGGEITDEVLKKARAANKFIELSMSSVA